MTTLALIGIGKWGRNYLKTVKNLDNVQIKYVSALHLESLKLLSKDYQPIFDINELNNLCDVDGIIIATPAETHFSIAKELLKNGHNLLIEKPLVLTTEEAFELKKIWDKNKPKVLVGHIQLYNPAYKACKIQLSKIGDIKKVFFKGLLSPKRKDISVLWDWGPHPISILLDLLGESPQDISVTEHAGRLKINLTYKKNISAEIEIGWVSNIKKRELIIEGKNGKIILDDSNKEQKKVSVYVNDNSVIFPKYDQTSPLEIEVQEFLNAINNDQSIISNLEFGVKVTKILYDIEKQKLSVNNL